MVITHAMDRQGRVEAAAHLLHGASSWLKPSSAKNSHAAARARHRRAAMALIVSRLSEGGQSIRCNRSARRPASPGVGERIAQAEAAILVVASSSSTPSRSMVEGARCSRGTAVGTMIARSAAREQHVVGREATIRAPSPSPSRHCPAGRDQRPAHSRRSPASASAQIDRRRGLSDAALLVGDDENTGLAGGRGRRRAAHDLDASDA